MSPRVKLLHTETYFSRRASLSMKSPPLNRVTTRTTRRVVARAVQLPSWRKIPQRVRDQEGEEATRMVDLRGAVRMDEILPNPLVNL